MASRIRRRTPGTGITPARANRVRGSWTASRPSDTLAAMAELVRNVSLDAGYFRRWYGNFLATDNLALAAADFNQFSVVAPNDSRLPGGGGQTIGGLVNVVPTKFGQTNNLLTFADNYGTQVENWQGFDVSVNARLRGGVLAQGGISTGRRITDACEIRVRERVARDVA